MPAVPMSLRIDEDLKAELEAEAAREDRSASYVLQQAAREYIARKEQFRTMVTELEAEADKGVFISSEKMRAWVASLGTDNELPSPEPDIFPAER
jgi:predicted transcriptional regulator